MGVEASVPRLRALLGFNVSDETGLADMLSTVEIED
jgi:hypothetical protein